MDNLVRLIPFVWPYRRRLALAIACAMMAAAFWSCSLGLSFPIVKVLMQGQTLHQYCAQELERCDAALTTERAMLAQLDEQIEALHGPTDERSTETLKLFQDRARRQSKISELSARVSGFERFQVFVLPHLPEDAFQTLAAVMAALLATTAAHGVFTFCQETLIGTVVEASQQRLRKSLFRRILALDYPSLALHGTADLTSRFTNDMGQTGQAMSLLGTKLVLEPLKIFGCLGGAMWLNWRLTLLSLACVPPGAWLVYRFGKKLKSSNRRQMEANSRLFTLLHETLASFKAVAAFGNGRLHRRRFFDENQNFASRSIRLIRAESTGGPLTELFAVLATFMALLPGAYLVLRHRESIWGVRLTAGPMDLAELAMLYALLAGMMDPVRKLSGVYSKLRKASAAADRIFELMDQQPLVQSPEMPSPAIRHSTSIAFERVSYRHPGSSTVSRESALDDVSLHVNFGEIVAIVGGNGSGKSTLLNLLPRLFDPARGEVRIDGVDVRSLDLKDLRRQIAVVTQETVLFDRSIRENIQYGRHDASPAEVEEAARQAFVSTFAELLPEGLETRVGPKGGRLSGGQRQRIALARALLRDPAILILDEATSAVDAHSEELILQALRDGAAHRTTLMIMHGLTPAALDLISRIAVMERGRLIAVGAHEALLRSCPQYLQLDRRAMEPIAA